jgi:hypothetical protein
MIGTSYQFSFWVSFAITSSFPSFSTHTRLSAIFYNVNTP